MNGKNIIGYITLTALAVGFVVSCGTSKKVAEIQSRNLGVQLTLPKEESFMPDLGDGIMAEQRDTLKITGLDGEEVTIMKAIQDEDGNMVAHEVLDAAVVTARFRNMAERAGKVDIEFQVIVPEALQDGRWQLRFNPKMSILEETHYLDPVVITGREYRKEQLKGYQQYERFLSRITSDSSRFVNINMLEIFLKRNLPEIFAFKTDSTFVTDQMFYSYYGLSQQQIVEHYTNKAAVNRNKKRLARKGRMYSRYVKSPIDKSGLRLDTVMQSVNGDFIYNYVQTVNTRPKLRKVDVVLAGNIYEDGSIIYRVPDSEPLTFYISSLSTFYQNTERYLTKVIERKAEANADFHIDFASGKYEIDEKFGGNASEIMLIKKNLASLINNKDFDLDSIVISAYASPEGDKRFNESLSINRAESISRYFNRWVKHYSDSLEVEKGFAIDEEGNIIKDEKINIRFRTLPGGENWEILDQYVSADTVMTASHKDSYFALQSVPNADTRERRMQSEPYYQRLREVYYPKLRTVRFNFRMHRKGMVKDTVHTTVLDTVYQAGVQALRDMDYENALRILGPYQDYNTAVAYVSMDRNASALEILDKLEKTAQVNYLLAIVYSRRGDDRSAVECYVRSCEQDQSYVHRGNLDPEIAALISRYRLNEEPEDEFEYSF